MRFKVLNLVLAQAEQHDGVKAAVKARMSRDEKVAFCHLVALRRGGLQVLIDFKSEEEMQDIMSRTFGDLDMMALGYHTIPTEVWELAIETQRLPDGRLIPHEYSKEEEMIGKLLVVSELADSKSAQPAKGKSLWQLRVTGSTQEIYPISTAEGQDFILLPAGKIVATFTAPEHYPYVVADMLRRLRQDSIEIDRQAKEASEKLAGALFGSLFHPHDDNYPHI